MKGGETMKKNWKKPEIEVLDVNMTMTSLTGTKVTDQVYPADTYIPSERVIS